MGREEKLKLKQSQSNGAKPACLVEKDEVNVPNDDPEDILALPEHVFVVTNDLQDQLFVVGSDQEDQERKFATF